MPDLGAHAGDLARSYRRTSITASLIYRIDSTAPPELRGSVRRRGRGPLRTAGHFDTTPIAARRAATGWDSGVLGLAGIRFYRTSGVFFSIEATIHGIDTPREWTVAYDGTFLMGVEIGP